MRKKNENENEDFEEDFQEPFFEKTEEKKIFKKEKYTVVAIRELDIFLVDQKQNTVKISKSGFEKYKIGDVIEL